MCDDCLVDESAPDLILQVPDDLARLLVEEGLADYHFQESRDSSLVALLIVAAASSAVTVAAKDLTTQALVQIGRSIAAWRSRHSRSVDHEPAEISLEIASTTRITVTLPSSTSESEAAAAIIDAMRQIQIEQNSTRDGRNQS